MARVQKIEMLGKRRGVAGKKWRIGIDARNLHRSTGRYTRGLLNELEKIDSHNEYHVIINPDDQGAWKPTGKNFHLHVVDFKHYSFGEQLGFARYLKRMKLDLVHFTMPQQPLLYFGKRVTSILDLTIVRFQNLDKNRYIYWIEQKIFTVLLWLVAKRSKQIITISKYVKQDIIDFAKINPQKITVTYPAAEKLATASSKPVKSLENSKFLLFVGNALTHKNLYKLVDAFALLQTKNPEYRLVLVGQKEFFYERLQEYITAQNIPNVDIMGFLPDPQLAWLYTNATAYVFPSLSEGFGLPGLEAMIYDLPVASSNATSLPEVYGDAATYFDPNNTKDIASVLGKLIKDKKLREKLIKNGQKKLQEYSWSEMAEKSHKVYLKALR